MVVGIREVNMETNLNIKTFSENTSGEITSMNVVGMSPAPGPKLENNKTTTITNNGTIEITPSATYDAMKKVTATVNVSGSSGTRYRWYPQDSRGPALYESSRYVALFSDATLAHEKLPSEFQYGDVIYAVVVQSSLGYSSYSVDCTVGCSESIDNMAPEFVTLMTGRDWLVSEEYTEMTVQNMTLLDEDDPSYVYNEATIITDDGVDYIFFDVNIDGYGDFMIPINATAGQYYERTMTEMMAFVNSGYNPNP